MRPAARPQVWRATWQGTTVACKLFHAAADASPASTQQHARAQRSLKKEAALMARLRHPNGGLASSAVHPTTAACTLPSRAPHPVLPPRPRSLRLPGRVRRAALPAAGVLLARRAGRAAGGGAARPQNRGAPGLGAAAADGAGCRACPPLPTHPLAAGGTQVGAGEGKPAMPAWWQREPAAFVGGAGPACRQPPLVCTYSLHAACPAAARLLPTSQSGSTTGCPAKHLHLQGFEVRQYARHQRLES